MARFRTALALVATLSLSGCLEHEETLALKSDGSGTLAIDETIDLSVEDELKKVFPEYDPSDGLKLPTKDEIKKGLTADGVELRACEVETRGKVTHLKAEVAFRDLAALRQLEGFSDRRLELVEKGDDVVVRYVLDGKKLMGMPFDNPKEKPQDDEMSKKIQATLDQAREKARVHLVLKLPEKPAETSGERVAGDDTAVGVTALGKPGAKPHLGSGEDIVLTATVKRAALEKALEKEKRAKGGK
jgi:hypothetical protein